MGLEAILARDGYTLPGQQPKTITEEGGEAHFGGDISPMARVARALNMVITQKKLDDQEKQKKISDQMDTYKTLREAGYTPAKAHAAVMKGDFPENLPEKDSVTDVKIDQVKAETARTKAETDILGTKKVTIEAKIMNKLANGEDLTPGEQKIYDDVIKKKNNGGLAELLSQLDNNSTGFENTPAEDNKNVDADIAVTSPDGKNGFIKASKWASAQAKGFKKRKVNAK